LLLLPQPEIFGFDFIGLVAQIANFIDHSEVLRW
jgi:hypothetical protein